MLLVVQDGCTSTAAQSNSCLTSDGASDAPVPVIGQRRQMAMPVTAVVQASMLTLACKSDSNTVTFNYSA
jgi:hypothetical protein